MLTSEQEVSSSIENVFLIDIPNKTCNSRTYTSNKSLENKLKVLGSSTAFDATH